MKCKHTRKQIIEAITYWKNVLKSMNESSKLLTVLSNKYGNNLVLSDNRTFSPTTNDAYDLFNILNAYVFHGKLPKCEICCSSYADIISKLQSLKLTVPSTNKFYGMFRVVVDDDNLHTMDDEIVYLNKLIFINTSLLKNSNFMFMCSSLCHEMIHLYGTTLYGEEPLCDKTYILYRKYVDVHTSPTFIQFKRKANDMGLTVINDASGLNFSELNTEAFQNMINSIMNDGVNIDESKLNNACNKAKICQKMPNGKISLLHIDCI